MFHYTEYHLISMFKLLPVIAKIVLPRLLEFSRLQGEKFQHAHSTFIGSFPYNLYYYF